MRADGLAGEVETLRDAGVPEDAQAMQGLGYKEIVSYLDGEYDLDTAIDIIKRDTRHFAKRQLTWFRREKDVMFLNYEDYSNSVNMMCDKIYDVCQNKNMKGTKNEQ